MLGGAGGGEKFGREDGRPIAPLVLAPLKSVLLVIAALVNLAS